MREMADYDEAKAGLGDVYLAQMNIDTTKLLAIPLPPFFTERVPVHCPIAEYRLELTDDTGNTKPLDPSDLRFRYSADTKSLVIVPPQELYGWKDEFYYPWNPY
jgi:hypothetical protein